MGGSVAPVFWDGAGGTATTDLRMTDKVAVMTLGLSQPLTPITEAKPGLVTLGGAPIAEPPAIVLPASMEAAVR